jgi:hypothetical protein
VTDDAARAQNATVYNPIESTRPLPVHTPNARPSSTGSSSCIPSSGIPGPSARTGPSRTATGRRSTVSSDHHHWADGPRHAHRGPRHVHYNLRTYNALISLTP